MSTNPATRAYLIFTGTGPILILSTYPELTDERLVAKLRYKGIDKFIAHEVALDAVRARYEHSFENVAADLESAEDIRVLDFNGHQIMANFSLDELGEPIKVGG
jgi:predicted ABC-type ATPase